MANKDNLPQPLADLFSAASVRAEQGWKKLPFRVASTRGPVSGQTVTTTTNTTARSPPGKSLNLEMELPSMLSGSVTSGAGSATTGMLGGLTRTNLLSKTTRKPAKSKEELLQEQVFAARMMGVPVTLAGSFVGNLQTSASRDIGTRPSENMPNDNITISLNTRQNVTKQTLLQPAQQAQAHLIATAFYNAVKPVLPPSANETIQAASQIQQLTVQQQQLLAQLNVQQQQKQQQFPAQLHQQGITLQAQQQQVPGPTAAVRLTGKVQPQKWSNRAQAITANKNANADPRQQRITPAWQNKTSSNNIPKIPESQTGIVQQVIPSTSNITGLQDPRRIGEPSAVSYPIASSPLSSTISGTSRQPQKQSLRLLEKARVPVSVELQMSQSLEVLQSLKADGYIDSPNRDNKILSKDSGEEPQTDDVDEISTMWPSTRDEDWNPPEPVPKPPNYKSRPGKTLSKSSQNSRKLKGEKNTTRSQKSSQSPGSILRGTIDKPTDEAPKSPWHACVDAFLESTKRENDTKFKTREDSRRRNKSQTPEDSKPVISTSLFSTATATEIPFLSEVDTDETISSIDRRVEMLKKQKEQILQDQMDEFCKEINEIEDGAGDSGPVARQKKTTPDQKGDRDRTRSEEQDKSILDDRSTDKDRGRERRMGTRSPPRKRPTDAKRARSVSHHQDAEKRKRDKSPPSPKRLRSGSLDKTKKDQTKDKESPKEMDRRQGRYPASDQPVPTETRRSHSLERKRKRPDAKMGEVFIDGRWQRSVLVTTPPDSKTPGDLLTESESKTKDTEAKKMKTKLDENEDQKETGKANTPSKKADQEKKAKPAKMMEQRDKEKENNMPSQVTDKKDQRKNDTSTTSTKKKDEKATPSKETEKTREKRDTPISTTEKKKRSVTPSKMAEGERKNAAPSTSRKEMKEATAKMNEKSSTDTKKKPGGTSAKADRQTGVAKTLNRTAQEVDNIGGLTESLAVSKSSEMTAVSSDTTAAQASSCRVAVSVHKSSDLASDDASPSRQLSDVAASSPKLATPTAKPSSFPLAAEGSKQSTDLSSVNSSSKSSASPNEAAGGEPTIGEISRKRKGDGVTETAPCKVSAISADSSSALEIKDSSIAHQMGLLKSLSVEQHVQDKVMLEWFCYVCGSICHTLKVYMSHIGGRKHKYRYSTLLKANYVTMEKELISKLKLLPKQGSGSTLGSGLLGQSLGLAAKQNPSASQQAGSSEGSYCKICSRNYSCSHYEHWNSVQHKKLEITRPCCVPCNLIFQKSVTYRKHITTVTHKKNVAAQEKPAVPVTSHVTEPPATGENSSRADSEETEPPQEKPSVIGSEFITQISGFFCKLCSKFYNNETTAREVHCATALHIAKTQQYYASRNQSSGTSFKASQGAVLNETAASIQAALAENVPTESSVGLPSAAGTRSAGNYSSSSFPPSSVQSMSSDGQMFADGASLRSDHPDKAEMPRSIPDSKMGEVASQASAKAAYHVKTVTTEAKREAAETRTVIIEVPRFKETEYMEAEGEPNKSEEVLPTKTSTPEETVSKATKGIPRNPEENKHKGGATLKESKVEEGKPAEATTCRKAISKIAEMNPENPEGGTKPKKVKSDVGKPGANTSRKEITHKEAKPIEAEPIEAEPIEAEPIEAEPIEAEPMEAELMEAELMEAELMEAELMEAKQQTVEQEEIGYKERITIERALLEGVEEVTEEPQQIISTGKITAEKAEEKGTVTQRESTSKEAASPGNAPATIGPSAKVAAVKKSPIEDPVPTETTEATVTPTLEMEIQDSGEIDAIDRDVKSKAATATTSSFNTTESKNSESTIGMSIEDPSKKATLEVGLPSKVTPLETKFKQSEITECHSKVSSLKEASHRRASPRVTRSTKNLTDDTTKESTVACPVKTPSHLGSKTKTKLKETSANFGGKSVETAILSEAPCEEALLKETLANNNATPKRITFKETMSKGEIPPKSVTPKKAPANNSKTEVPSSKDNEITPKSTSKEPSQRILTKEDKPAEETPLNASAEIPPHKTATCTETIVKVTAPESTTREVRLKQAILEEVMPKEAKSKTISPKEETAKGVYQKDIASRQKASSVLSRMSVSSIAPNSSHLKNTNSKTTTSKVVVLSPERSSTRLINAQSTTLLPVTETQHKGSSQKKASKEAPSEQKLFVNFSKSAFTSDKSTTPAQTNTGDNKSSETKKVQPISKTASTLNVHTPKTSIKTEVTDSSGDSTSKTVKAKGKMLTKKPQSPAVTSASKLGLATSTEKKQPVSATPASDSLAKRDNSKLATSKVQDFCQGSSNQNEISVAGTTETANLTLSSPSTTTEKASESKSPSLRNGSPVKSSYMPDVLADASADEEQGEYIDVHELMAGDVIILDEDSDQEMDTAYGDEEDVVIDTVGEVSDILRDVSRREEEPGDDWIIEEVEGDVEEEEGRMENPEDDVEGVGGYVEDVEGYAEDSESDVEDIEGSMEGAEGSVKDAESNVEDVDGFVDDIDSFVDVEGSLEGTEGSLEDIESSLEDIDGFVEDIEGFVDEGESSVDDGEGSVDDGEGSVEDTEGSVEDTEGDVENVMVNVEDVVGYMEDGGGAVEDIEGFLKDAEGFLKDAEGSVEDGEGSVEDTDGNVEDVEGYVEDVVGDVDDVDGYVDDVEGSMEGMDCFMDDVEGYIEDVEGYVEDGAEEDSEGDEEEAGFEMPNFEEMFAIDEVGESDEEEIDTEGVGDQDVHQVEEWEILSEVEE